MIFSPGMWYIVENAQIWEDNAVFLKILLILLIIPAAFLALTLLFLLVMAVSMLFVDTNRLYDRINPYYRFLADGTDWIVLFYSNVRVHLIGEEKLPKESLYLLVSNHRSGYDPLCTMYALRKEKPIFISKPENFQIPAIGRLARSVCFRPIDRENARNALATIKDCAKLLKNNVAPVAVYPEGTRSKTGDLLPFHNSVFKIAQEANVPIVVMTVKGTDRIRSNAPWHKTDVALTILDVLSAEHVKASRSAQLGEEIRQIMEADFGNADSIAAHV